MYIRQKSPNHLINTDRKHVRLLALLIWVFTCHCQDPVRLRQVIRAVSHPRKNLMSNIDKYKTDLESLSKLGEKMDLDLTFRHMKDQGELDKKLQNSAKKINGCLEKEYQSWYSESCAVIKQLLPDRLVEFEHLYKGEGKRKNVNAITYNMQDWLNGIRAGSNSFGEKYYDDFAIISMRFKTQLAILKSVEARFESTLFDIKQLVQADLFDSELDAARELIKRGFLRGAGAISGVVLEKHLAQVAENHNVKTRKKSPTISDFNDLLKGGDVLDVPSWRQIQRLGDIRNLCDHNKDRDPTKEEVEELVSGVEKFTKTLF